MENEEKDPEQEENIQDADEREKMVEDAEISSNEEGFVKGYEDDEEESMEGKSQEKDD